MKQSRGFTVAPVLLVVIGVMALSLGAYVMLHKDKTSNNLIDVYLQPAASSTRSVTTSSQNSATTVGDFVPLSAGQKIVDQLGYMRDASGVFTVTSNGGFSKGGKVIGADPATFQVSKSWSIFGKDAAHVYVEGEMIPGADPSSFVALCGYPTMLETFCAYGKDKAHVYAYARIIPNADPKTFVSLRTNGAVDPGKGWTTAAVDSSAFYNGYVPTGYSLEGLRISTLSDGTPLHFQDTSKVVAVNSNDASWGGYYEGVRIGTKSYYGGTYFVDGTNVYTFYSACDVDGSGKESNCKPMISRVNKVGDKPVTVSASANVVTPIGSSWGKDATKVYCNGNVIAGADVATARLGSEGLLVTVYGKQCNYNKVCNAACSL